MDNTPKTPNATVTLLKNGPMIIKGSFKVTGIDGNLLPLTDQQKTQGVALCRCGKSANPPFCDGSHAK